MAGLLYHDKTIGHVDMPKAISFYEKACGLGDMNSCNNMGAFYENGIVVKKDLNRAIELYAKACNSGDASSCSNLGHIYALGRRCKAKYTKSTLNFLKRLVRVGSQNGV